jgi:hypothetical protein
MPSMYNFPIAIWTDRGPWWLNHFAALSVFQRTGNGDKVEHDDVGDHLTEPDAARMGTH